MVSIDVIARHVLDTHLFLPLKPTGKSRRFKAKSDDREVTRNSQSLATDLKISATCHKKT